MTVFVSRFPHSSSVWHSVHYWVGYCSLQQILCSSLSLPPCHHLGFIRPWSTHKNHIYLGSTSGHSHTHTTTFSSFGCLWVDTRVASISWLLWMMDAAVNAVVQITRCVAFISLGLTPRVCESTSLLALCFPRSHRTVSHKPTLTYIFINCQQGFYSLHILITTIFVVIFTGVRWYLWSNIISLILYIIIIYIIYISTYIIVLMVPSTIFHIPAGNVCVFFRYVSRPFSHSSIRFLVLSWIPCIFWILIPTFQDTRFAKIFSDSIYCRFLSWIVLCTTQKLLNEDVILFVYFFILLYVTLVPCPNKIAVRTKIKNLSPGTLTWCW